MREIKFQFIYQGQPYSETNQERPIVKKVYSLSEFCGKGLESICDVHRFMDLIAKRQYTGIEDKNGVEIYEGDIVRVMVNELTTENMHKDPAYKEGKKYLAGNKIEALWTIEHVNHMCYTGFNVYGKNRRFNRPLTKSVVVNNKPEVIGNIYENPELLNNA